MISRQNNKRLFIGLSRFTAAFVLAAGLLSAPSPADAASRIKDVVNFEGVRDNLLVGYGLVVGLNGTGDSLRNSPFTRQSLQSMLERLGVNVRNVPLNTDNVAAVMVSANLPPFSRHGSRIDVTVSTIGDAKNLLGGTLLVTPLLGADGQVYSVAQGPVVVGGFTIDGDAQAVIKGVPTSGRVPNGGVIEQEIPFEMSDLRRMRLALKNPDFTTARRIAEAINTFLGVEAAIMSDPGTVVLTAPLAYANDMTALLADIEQLRVEPDQPARVVIDETTGVIVLGSDVRVNTVAIAQGSLSIRVTETPQVSQPAPFAQAGETVTVPRTQIDVIDGNSKLAVVESSLNLRELVDGLNSLGVSPRDMISILQALKTAGALQAEIVLM
jgi:flagellar P-ring protein precursor FlgI